VWAEVRRAANAPLPRFEDHDASGRYGLPDGAPVRISALGDSSLTGPGLGHGSHVWIARLAEALPWDVELSSHARGGSRVADVLRRQVPAALGERPDLFVLAVGANDAIHVTPTRQFSWQLGFLLDQLRSVAPVVTLGIGDLSVIPRVPRSLKPALARRSAAVDRVHRRVAERREGVVRVPVSELSDPHFRRMGADLFVEDLFHPGRDGHQLWADLFRPHVHDALHEVVGRSRGTAPAR
jgi:lysophospholipase L1-like esterase